MRRFYIDRKSKKFRKFILTVVLIVMLISGGVLAVRQVYKNYLQPASNSEAVVIVEIPRGATPHEIAVLLEDNNIIKKAWAFEWYVRNTGVREDLKAGSYALTPNLGVEKVVQLISRGEVATNLITILPGQRLELIRKNFVDAGFDPTEVDEALDASLYKDHPALVDKPKGANLEGYIYPETFHITADTTAQEIVRASLNELQAHLTPTLRAGIVKQGLTVHQGIILASIIEKEVGTLDERNQVAQVFLSRLEKGLPLGADATTRYAVKNYTAPLTIEELNSDSAYNTRKATGLTPGPIGNFTVSSLEAVSSPAEGDYIFFVTGNDGVTRFSHTFDEHENLIQTHGASGE